MALFSDCRRQRGADIRGTLHAMNSRGGHRFVFFLRRAGAAADDRAGMSHAPAGWRRLPGDETHHRLFHVRMNIFGRLLLRVSTNFTDQNDRARIRIFVK